MYLIKTIYGEFECIKEKYACLLHTRQTTFELKQKREEKNCICSNGKSYFKIIQLTC